MPLSISLLRASWLVIWRPALLPWGDGKYHNAPWQALVITEKPEQRSKMRAGCSLVLSAASQPRWAQHAAWAPGQPCQRCPPEHSRSIGEVNWGLPSHMEPLISTFIAKRQQRRHRIWHPTSLHLSPSTSRSCWQPLRHLPAQHTSFLNHVLQFLLPARQTYHWASAKALLPVGWDISLWCLLTVSCESPNSPQTAQGAQVPCNAPQCCSGGHCHEVLHQIATAMLNIWAPCSFISPCFPRHVCELLQIIDF